MNFMDTMQIGNLRGSALDLGVVYTLTHRQTHKPTRSGFPPIMKTPISDAFNWSGTLEGHTYWEKFYMRGYKSDTSYYLTPPINTLDVFAIDMRKNLKHTLTLIESLIIRQINNN